jgi:hypothetical protein
LDGSLPNEERLRTKLPEILNLDVNSIITGSVDERISNFSNLSVTVTNGGFDSNTTGWNATRATLASVVGGQSGNCLEITYTSGPTNSAADRLITGLVPGLTYTISAYVKSGTSGNGGYQIVVYPKIINVPLVTVAGTSSGAWVEATNTFVNPAGNSDVNIYLIKNNADAGTMLFDTVTISAVAPAAPTDGWVGYSADISAGNAAPHFRTENGTVIKLDQAIDTTASPTFDHLHLTTGPITVAGTQVLGAQAAAQADLKADYTTGDLDTEAEVIAAINATNAGINTLLAKLRTHGILST